MGCEESRLHRIEFQDRTGKVHVLEGKQLPNYLSVHTGTGQKVAMLRKSF